MELLQLQRDSNSNSLSNEQVETVKVKELMKHVQNRKTKGARSQYKEKLDKEILPYVNSMEYPRIEERMWDFANRPGDGYTALCALRNRDCLLTSKSAILRGESLFYGELSDCLDVIHESHTGDPTPYHIAIQQIDSGKTHRLRKGHVSVTVLHPHIYRCPFSSSCLTFFRHRKCLVVVSVMQILHFVHWEAAPSI